MTPYYERDGITIYVGDCRDVLPALPPVDVVLTDPPYGDNHNTDYRRFSGGAAQQSVHPAIHGDDEQFDPRPWLSAAPTVVMFGANRYSDRLPTGSWLIWDKRTPTGSKNVMSDAEVAWWNRGRGVYIFAHTWDGFNRASERRQIYHPTQKPVALMRWCLERVRAKGTVLDPYMGSGPVLLAAQQLGLSAIGCDTEERYCETAAKRLMQEVLPLGVPA